jgi:hypothetical protein
LARPAPGSQEVTKPPSVVCIDPLPLSGDLVGKPGEVPAPRRGHKLTHPLFFSTSGQQFPPEFLIHPAIDPASTRPPKLMGSKIVRMREHGQRSYEPEVSIVDAVEPKIRELRHKRKGQAPPVNWWPGDMARATVWLCPGEKTGCARAWLHSFGSTAARRDDLS